MNYFPSFCIHSIPPSFVFRSISILLLYILPKFLSTSNFFSYPVPSGITKNCFFHLVSHCELLINLVYSLFQYILSLRKRILKSKMLSVFLSIAAILSLAHIHFFQLLIKYLNSFYSVGQRTVFLVVG